MDRDTVAMQMFGKPYAQLTPFEQFRVDDSIANSPKPGPSSDTQTLQGPDGRTHLYQWNPATNKYDIDLGLTGNAPTGTTVNVASASPASAGSLTLEDIQRMVQEAGGRLTNYGGVYRAIFADGSYVDYQPSAKDPKSGALYYNPGSLQKPGGAAASSPASKAAASVQQAKDIAAGMLTGQGNKATSTQNAYDSIGQTPPQKSGTAGTPESNPLLGESLFGGRSGKEYFGTYVPAGGGSSLLQPGSINSSTSTLAAMGYALPADQEQRVAQELYASSLMQQFGFKVAKAMLDEAKNTGGLTTTEAASVYGPEQMAWGGQAITGNPWGQPVRPPLGIPPMPGEQPQQPPRDLFSGGGGRRWWEAPAGEPQQPQQDIFSGNWGSGLTWRNGRRWWETIDLNGNGIPDWREKPEQEQSVAGVNDTWRGLMGNSPSWYMEPGPDGSGMGPNRQKRSMAGGGNVVTGNEPMNLIGSWTGNPYATIGEPNALTGGQPTREVLNVTPLEPSQPMAQSQMTPFARLLEDVFPVRAQGRRK